MKCIKRASAKSLAVLLAAAVLTTAARAAELPAVAVTEVIPSSLTAAITVTGSVHSRNSVQINAGIDAQLQQVAEPGTRVAAGDELVRFNAEPLRLQQVEQEALIARQQVQLDYLGRELKRMLALKKRSTVSDDELEQVQSRRDLARSDLAVARARLDIINERLARSVIKAPFAGTLVQRLRRGGEEVNRGELLAQLQDTLNLELRVPVPIKYFSRVAVGDWLMLEKTLEQPIQGRVRTVIPSVDSRSQTFEIRIDLPLDKGVTWTPGQLLSTEIPLKSDASALAVPRDALLLRRDGTYVVRIGADDKAERIEVTLGSARGQWIEVSGALNAGDRVAISGAERLREGQQVSVEKAS